MSKIKEEWIVDELEDPNIVINKTTKEFICRTNGKTINECLNLSYRIAKLPELEEKITELTRTVRELQSQVYHEQLRPYKIECEKSRIIQEMEYYKERLQKYEDVSNLF
jgi:hypothetical protein